MQLHIFHHCKNYKLINLTTFSIDGWNIHMQLVSEFPTILTVQNLYAMPCIRIEKHGNLLKQIFCFVCTPMRDTLLHLKCLNPGEYSTMIGVIMLLSANFGYVKPK